MQADNADANTSLSHPGILQGLPESLSGKATTKSALENSRDNSKGAPRCGTRLKKIKILSGFFNASIFAAHIPLVSAADAGDDFSNNLFTDLAPILALFGEQVAKQYMSQSMSKVEDLIFACAPLGIITAMVSAIRVGGPGVLRAIIGRARESRGVVEVELMSSTSADVCELWNGQGVIRVLGPSPIIELYYLQGDQGNGLNSGAVGGDDAIPLIERDKNDLGIWDFKSAVSTGLLKNRNPLEADGSASPGSPLSHEVVPNIGLNLSGQRVSDLEFILVAAAGIVLQAGVVVFAGAGMYLPTWNERFKKDNEQAQKHSFPSMAGGTVALVIGMFLCCYIVERSTTENNWEISEPAGRRVRVAWLQKGGEVNDQHFKSYILHRGTKTSKLRNAIPKFVKTLLRSDTRLLIRTSHQGSPKNQVPLTMVAVIISLAGFVLQFVGLRALKWQVTIAQLVATGAMTGLRAMVRRNLIHKPEGEEIKEGGYELEAMAMKISGCNQWDVTTWKPGPGGGLMAVGSSPAGEPSAPVDASDVLGPDGFRFASEVMDARRRLGALSKWSSECQKTAGIVAQAIEASMNFLWTNSDVNLSNNRPSEMFEWKLFVEVSKAQGGEGSSTTTFVQLRVSRKILPNGAWGPWKAVRNEIEAVLGLWMHHLKKLELGSGSPTPNLESNWREDEQAVGISKTHRTVGSGDPSNESVYKKWILPQTELASTDAKNIIGRPNPHGAECLAALSETSLERICGQHIFSTFLANVVDRAVDSMNGKMFVRGSEQGTRDSLGLRNTVIDGLLNVVERTGLATTEDALLSIVPALGGKYSAGVATTEAFSDLAIEISTYLEVGQFERAEALLLWLLDTAESVSKRHEEEQNWLEACKTYILLYKTYTRIGSENYARRTEEATGLFCERFRSFHQAVGEEATRKTLDLVEGVWGEMQMDGWGEIEQRLERRLKRREQAIYLAPTGTAGERLCRAAVGGDYLGVMSQVHTPDIDINSHDSLGRTSLILACLSGHANITIQLLRGNADPCRKDQYQRTAIHYAARRNDTSVLHALLLHEKAGKVINALDEDGNAPLGLAIQSSAGAAVALLIFYGAEDPEGSAKELLKLSASKGSYAAVKVAMDNNSKDGKYGRTSLHWAVWRGEAAAAELLPRESAEVEVQGDDGLAALHLAASSGCDSTVGVLIQKLGADVGAETKDGKTALHLACAGGHHSTVEFLIHQLSADMDTKTRVARTALHLACAGGHHSTVEFLVRKFQVGADVEVKNRDGQTALHLACAGGHESIVKFLIQQLGADMNAKTEDEQTALHLACAGGHHSTVEFLVRKFQVGADVEVKNRDGQTALHLACAGGHDSIVKFLIQQLGADMNAKTEDEQTALHLACAGGHHSTVEFLVRKIGADVEVKNRDGQTALHLACAGGQDSTVEFLIQQLGADMNARTEGGQAALHLACAGGHDSTAELLVRKFGADVEAKKRDGQTALHLACAGGQDSIVEFLIQQLGADMNAKTEDEQTALHLACAGGHESTAELLVQKFVVDVEAKTRDGQTALHLACAGGHHSTVKFLIQQLGADMNAKTEDEQTALHLACAGGHESTAELLVRKFGADVEAKKRDGQTALHLACAGGHHSTVKFLIQKLDADMNAKTEDEQTALHLACAGGHNSTAQLLIRGFRAQRSLRDRFRQTALHLLVRYMYVPNC